MFYTNKSLNNPVNNNEKSESLINDEESQNIPTNKKYENKNNNFEKICTNCCIGFTAVSLILFVVAYFTWLFFAIKYLANTSNGDIKDKCEKSDLWVLLLVIVIVGGITLLTGFNNQSEEDNETKYKSNIIYSCLQIGLTIWTGIELNMNCAKNNLQDENIYKILNYWFYFGCVSIGFSFILCCCFIFKKPDLDL